MLISCFANALMVGRLKDASRATSAAPRISPLFRMGVPPLEPSSVEDVGDVEADDILTVGELRYRNRAGAAVDLPGAVLWEGVPLCRLVVAVLDLTVEVLGDQVLSCQRALVERAYGSRPRAAVVLEPLATDGRRDAVGEGIVGDGRKPLPQGGLVARRRCVLVSPVVVEQEGERGRRLDGGYKVEDAALVAGLVGLFGTPDTAPGQRQHVVHRVGYVPDTAPAVVVALDLVPAFDGAAGHRDLVGERVAHERTGVGERNREAKEERPTVIVVGPRLDDLGAEEGDELPTLHREALQERRAVVGHGPLEVSLLDLEVVGLERVAVLDRTVSVPVRLDVARDLAGVELHVEARDGPAVTRTGHVELPEDGDPIVVVLQRVQRDQASRTGLVEVPRVGLGEPRCDVDLGRVLNPLLGARDVVVLEVPERVEERVPLAARRVGRRLGFFLRTGRRPPGQAGRGQGRCETPDHERTISHSRPSLLRIAVVQPFVARHMPDAHLLKSCMIASGGPGPAQSRGTPAQNFGSGQVGRRGMSTRRRSDRTRSPRWFTARVST